MIVGRICSVQRGWRPPSICSLQDLPQRIRLHLAKRIVVESAMMYTAASLSAFITHACESRAVDITYLAVGHPIVRPITFLLCWTGISNCRNCLQFDTYQAFAVSEAWPRKRVMRQVLKSEDKPLDSGRYGRNHRLGWYTRYVVERQWGDNRLERMNIVYRIYPCPNSY